MKAIVISLVLVVALFSCKKEEDKGRVVYKINFKTNALVTKGVNLQTKAQVANLYSNFGDYITSLTPTKFIAHIWMIGYADTVTGPSGNDAQMLQYIEGNVTKIPLDDPSRMVDFSNNVTVTFNPAIYGRVNIDNQFVDKQIDFKYFCFLPRAFYHTIQLPNEYANVKISMFPVDSIVNNTLHISQLEMMRMVFPNANTGWGFSFVFGNTDSTYVVNPNGEMIYTSENNPMSLSPTNGIIIRSSKYTKMLYRAPLEGETVVMSGVLSFDTSNLIQVYAGVDNIPYTQDDIFVYAPNFWERISSSLEVQ